MQNKSQQWLNIKQHLWDIIINTNANAYIAQSYPSSRANMQVILHTHKQAPSTKLGRTSMRRSSVSGSSGVNDHAIQSAPQLNSTSTQHSHFMLKGMQKQGNHAISALWELFPLLSMELSGLQIPEFISVHKESSRVYTWCSCVREHMILMIIY